MPAGSTIFFMVNRKLRETFDVILGGKRTTADPPPDPSQDTARIAGTDEAPPPTIPAAELDRYVVLAEGGFFYPNFISDYVMRDLSLGEQSVFNRLLRLTQGVDGPSGKLRLEEVAEACGVTPEFALRTVQSLQDKGLMRVFRLNPFTRCIRYRLDVLKQWQGKLVLCAVCHAPIRPGEDKAMTPVARSSRGVQEVPVHRRCLQGEPV